MDTGNNLKDPLNNQPVIIVEQDALKGLLPPEIERVVAEVENGGAFRAATLGNVGSLADAHSPYSVQFHW